MNYADYPVSITEMRAEAASDSSMWSPRDALISMLREIDSGKSNPFAMVICYAEKADGETATKFMCSGPDCLTNLGLVSRVLYNMQSG